MLVGSLDRHGEPITGLLSLPEDALPPILQMMIGERFKFIVAHGMGFSHRHATVHGIRLEMNPDDLRRAPCYRLFDREAAVVRKDAASQRPKRLPTIRI